MRENFKPVPHDQAFIDQALAKPGVRKEYAALNAAGETVGYTDGALTACPKCADENGPEGHWEVLTAVEGGGATCEQHGFMSEGEISRLFAERRADNLDPATGIIIAALLSLAFWAVLVAVIYSTMR